MLIDDPIQAYIDNKRFISVCAGMDFPMSSDLDELSREELIDLSLSIEQDLRHVRSKMAHLKIGRGEIADRMYRHLISNNINPIVIELDNIRKNPNPNSNDRNRSNALSVRLMNLLEVKKELEDIMTQEGVAIPSISDCCCSE